MVVLGTFYIQVCHYHHCNCGTCPFRKLTISARNVDSNQIQLFLPSSPHNASIHSIEDAQVAIYNLENGI